MSQVSHPAPIPLRQILSRSNISVFASPGRDRDRDLFHVGAALSMRSNPSYQSKNSSIHASPTGSSTTTTTTMIASHHPRNNLPGAASVSSHPFEHTFAGAGRRSSAASLVGGGVASSLLNNTGGGSNSRRGSAVNFAASTSATRSTSGGTRDSSNNMIGREDNSLSRRQEDDDDDRSPSRPVSPRTAGPAEIGWGRDSKQGYASGAGGNGQSWLTGSPLVHPDAAPKPRDRLPSLALSFGFADELNPPPSAMDAHTGVLGSRKQSMTVGDAFSLAGFGLNAKNNGDTSWASDGTAGGADLLSLNTFRRKSSIIPPRFAPAPTVPSNGVRYPSSSANPLDRVADARPGESYLTARRSSNIGLLLNPVGDQDDAGKAADAPIDPNSGSPQHNYRRGAISAAPEWRGPQVDDGAAGAAAPQQPPQAVAGPSDPSRGGYSSHYNAPAYASLYGQDPRVSQQTPQPAPLGAFPAYNDSSRSHLSWSAGTSIQQGGQQQSQQQQQSGMPEPNRSMDGIDPLTGRKVTAASADMPRQFKCANCPASFVRNHDLRRHARIHLAVKPFACQDCGKPFSRKDALKRHILVKGCGGRRRKKFKPSEKEEKKTAATTCERETSVATEDSEPMAHQLGGTGAMGRDEDGSGEESPGENSNSNNRSMYSPGNMPTYGSLNSNNLSSFNQQQQQQAQYNPDSMRRPGMQQQSSYDMSNNSYLSLAISPSLQHQQHQQQQQQQQQQAQHLSHEANRARAMTLDSYPRAAPFAGMPYMWNSASAYNNGAQQQQQGLSPLYGFSQGGSADGQQQQQQQQQQQHMMASPFGQQQQQSHHFGSPHILNAATALLTREERRASLTRASSEAPMLPTHLHQSQTTQHHQHQQPPASSSSSASGLSYQQHQQASHYGYMPQQQQQYR